MGPMATVVIHVSLNTKQGCVDYSVTTQNGTCDGINQIADMLKTSVLSLPELTKADTSTVKEVVNA